MKYTPPESVQPWSSNYWDGKLTVSFGYASAGWIQMAILSTAGNQGVIIHCSVVYSPFQAMGRWLNEIVDYHFPAIWQINEEGWLRTFVVSIHDGETIDFQIWEESEDLPGEYPPKLILRSRIDRRQLLKEFCKRFTQYVREDFNPRQWPQIADDDPDVTKDLETVDLSKVLFEIEQCSAGENFGNC